MSAFHNSEAVVIDNGTGSIKAGFAGEDSPQVVLPTSMNFHAKLVAGMPGSPTAGGASSSASSSDGGASSSSSSSSSSAAAADGKDGDSNSNNAGSNKSSAKAGGATTFKRPIRRGAVEDWDSMTAAWRYVLHHEIGIDPESPE